MAVAVAGLRPDVDHDPIPLLRAPVDDRWPRLGDEVFLVGLFRSHYGKERNVPIIRVGNIAALPSPDEPIKTTYCGDIEAYLVEVKSVAGISGSPVFKDWYQETRMEFPGIIDPRGRPSDPEDINWFDYHFVGLVHGHFDAAKLSDAIADDDTLDADPAAPEKINTGIAIVVPQKQIFETLYQPELVADRRKIEEEWTSEASPDASPSDDLQ